MNRGRFFFLTVTIFFMVPIFASAQVVITETMYDPPGADAGHEWINIQNTGTSSIHLTDLRLRVSGANHKITALSGGDILGSQAHAVIVQDQSLFSQDNPSFVGSVFHSSFSLTNKSGEVDIVDKAGVVIASKSYQAPPPAPPAPQQKISKTKKTSAATKGSPVSSIDITPDTPLIASAEENNTAPATSAAQSSSSLWWIGTIALAGVASVATFASRRVARREWDISEEKETE